MNYRNRKLLDLAHRIDDCMFRLPGCTGWQEGGCEPIHSDSILDGKGMGEKSSDEMHVAGCHHCHLVYSGVFETSLSREERQEIFKRAQNNTMRRYLNNGWIGVIK